MAANTFSRARLGLELLSDEQLGGVDATLEQSNPTLSEVCEQLRMDRHSSSQCLLLFQSMLERRCQQLPNIGMVYQIPSTRESTDANYNEEIARLVKAHWQHDSQRLHIAVDWEVSDFITECLGSDGDLKAVLTVTGNACSAYGTTCRQYINWQWGAIGLKVLDMVCSFFKSNSSLQLRQEAEIVDVTLALDITRPSRCEVELSMSKMPRELSGYRLMLVTSVAQVIAWMASVFRIPKVGSPHCSSIQLPTTHSVDFHVKLGALIPATRTDSKCWHDLLPSTTVATGFPIRIQESGLDVGWELMLDLADVIFSTDLSNISISPPWESGIFYSGVNTILYPVSKSKNLICWHFDLSGKTARPPPGHFLPVTSEQTFANSKHLVGFAVQSEIRLGTSDRIRDYEQMRSVVAPVEKGRPELAIETVGATFGRAPVLAMVGGGVRFPSPLRATIDPQMRRYDDIIRKTKAQAVILYDCGIERGAWLVPQLCVIFDLICYRMFKEQLGQPPRHPKTSVNGGDATAEVLKDPLVYQRKLWKISEDNSDFKIMDLVKEIYEAMLKRQILHETRSGGIFRLHRERLHGWDLLEIADPPDKCHRREIDVHKTTSRAIAQYPCWLLLTQHIPVYLGHDLGHIITVSNQPLPMRRFRYREKYLVANGSTLQLLRLDSDQCSHFHFNCELIWELPSSPNSMFLRMTELSRDLVGSRRIKHCVQKLCEPKNHMCNLDETRAQLCPDSIVIFGPKVTKLSKLNDMVDAVGLGAKSVGE